MEYSFSETFHLQKGYLYCEGVNIKNLRDKLQSQATPSSPFYLYSKAQVEKNVTSYKLSLEKTGLPHILGYSIKANYSPSVLTLVRELGCTAVAVSGNEIQLALQLGFDGHKIVYNGNGKQAWEVDLAVCNDCLLNVDSEFDLTRVVTVARKLGKTARILLRLNPNIDPKVHPYVATGLAASKFGIEESHVCALLPTIREHSAHVQLVGLHCHLGSTIENTDVFRDCVDVMLDLIDRVKAQGFTSLQYLNVGGGLGLDYKQHSHRTQAPDPSGGNQTGTKSTIPNADDLVACIGNNSKLRESGLTLILEPGRSIVASACVLVTTVLGVKCNGTERYTVVDASMTEVIRPSLYGAYHHLELIEPTQSEGSTQYALTHVVGPVCESADFLGKERWLPVPHEGCGLAVFDTGAYCSSMGSNYNMRVRPAEVLVDGAEWTVVRKPDTLEDMLRPYTSTTNT